MAFSFLDAIGPIASLVGQLRGQSQANRAIKNNNVPTAAEKQSQALYAALADPNSPLLQQFTQQQKALNLDDFQRQIKEMQLADRRAGQMGRAPTFFQPERADEIVNYLTTRGMPQLNANAQSQAIQRITEAAQGIRGAQPAQAGRLNTNMQRQVSQAAYGSGIPERLVNLFTSGGQQQSPVTVPMTNDEWNRQHGNINWNISR